MRNSIPLINAYYMKLVHLQNPRQPIKNDCINETKSKKEDIR